MTGAMVGGTANAAVGQLLEARAGGTSVEALDPAPTSPEEAYAIADAVAAGITAPVLGWKIGCTSEFAQEVLGTDGPISGRVYDLRPSGATYDLADCVGAHLEGEMAFTMGSELSAADAPFEQATVEAAVSTLHPAIEVVGGRMANFLQQPILTTMADSGANSALILGEPVTDWKSEDLPAAPGVMTMDGEQTGAGTGADVLGHPLAALTWLANHLAARGISINAGEVITTGTCTQVTPAKAGGTATVDFGRYGSASATFLDSRLD